MKPISEVIFLLCVGLILCSQGLADLLPPYLPPVQGTLITSIFDRSSLALTPGQLDQCQETDAGDVVTYKCTLKNAGATVTDAVKGSMALNFPTMLLIVSSASDKGTCYDYYFSGTYDSKAPTLHSETLLELFYYVSAPSVIRGTLKLVDFGVSGAIQASPLAGIDKGSLLR